MRYRALFIGGPIDGQERVLSADHSHITVPVGRPPCVCETAGRPPCVCETVVYVLLFAYGREKTLIYSVWNIEETLNRIWTHYTGGRYAHPA